MDVRPDPRHDPPCHRGVTDEAERVDGEHPEAPRARLKDGRDRYRAQFRDAASRQVVRQFRIKRDAQDWLDQVAHDRIAGLLTDSRAGRQTLQELYDEVHAARRFSPKTIEIHAGAWAHVPAAVRRPRPWTGCSPG